MYLIVYLFIYYRNCFSDGILYMIIVGRTNLGYQYQSTINLLPYATTQIKLQIKIS